MPTGIDHVVILVNELDHAVQQYRDLGFTVTPGGKHARFTHNALVPFHDGSYLELIAFYEMPEEGSSDTHRWYKWVAKGGGIIDFALGEPNMDALISDATARGVQYTGPHPGQRARPDNQQLKWSMGQVGGENVGALPFLIQDVTDRGLRVPLEHADHENGVRGIRALSIAVNDLDAATQRYCKLLGRDEPSGTNVKTIENADGVYFLVGDQRIDVVTPTGPGPLADQLKDRGDSPFELALLSPTTKSINPKDAGGARLRLIAG
jgi:catechol 2,3-dioxygenase-like lactoylglutathione lyase family enzyme